MRPDSHPARAAVRRRAARRLAVLVPLLLLAGAPGGAGETGADRGDAMVGGDGATVVLELFTSQGCSSCPAADRLLAELAADPALAGRVFPLAFHVDYWNHLGWRDRFSAPQWTARQRRYAARLAAGRVYTPQLVVDGRLELVGSRPDEVRQRVALALDAPDTAPVTLAASLSAHRVAGTVEVAAPRLPGSGLGVWVALFENGLQTPVGRGENAGRQLRNDRVVRRLEGLGEVRADGLRTTFELPLEREWDRSRLGVVAFVQDAGGAIHGAAQRVARPDEG